MSNVIQTERLTLIELTADQIDAFHTVWSDPEATKWSLHGTNTTIEASREWMAGVLRSPEHDTRRSWTVYVKGVLDPGQCNGIVTLRPLRESGKEDTIVNDRWELGYLFRPQYWGRGYATESCQAAIDSLRKDVEESPGHGRAALMAYVDPGNDRSLNVLKKLGLEVVGHRKMNTPDRFLAGQWRKAENLILKRDLWGFKRYADFVETTGVLGKNLNWQQYTSLTCLPLPYVQAGTDDGYHLIFDVKTDYTA